MLALVKAVMDQRAAERSYGITEAELTPVLRWSLPALRRVWNQRKAWCAPWWGENSKEAYHTGLDALARGLDAWSKSRTGQRKGRAVGFPRFKSARAPRSVRFTTGTIRIEADRRHVTLPRLGAVRTHESTRKLARRIEAGTARKLSATVRQDSAGRWHCALQVIVEAKARPAHAQRSAHPVVGVDVGVKADSLLVMATPEGIEVDRASRRRSRSPPRTPGCGLCSAAPPADTAATTREQRPSNHRRSGGARPRPASAAPMLMSRRCAVTCCTRPPPRWPNTTR
jgi:putative transposase